jgi:hypothetical protein
MYLVKRSGQVAYEDLLRELEVVEQQLLSENSAIAMNLMVLEAKFRERFQRMEEQSASRLPFTDEDLFMKDDISMDDVMSLLPQELPPLPTLEQVENRRRKKKSLETVGMAAVLAVVTACGVFGLASMIQIALSWLA